MRKQLLYSRVALFLVGILLVGLPLLSHSLLGQRDPFSVQASSSSAQESVIVINFDVPVDSGSSGLVARAISQAETSGAVAVIIEMNTPGGLLSDMISITNSIANSSVPVYTYIPNGSLAASAGSYIAMASKKILMGPGSEIGPSTPEVIGGSALEQNHTASAMLALMLGLAEKNDRNTTAAFNMVVYDLGYSEQQAMQYHVADYASLSLAQTLQQLNLSSASVVTISESPVEQLLSTLAAPP